MTRMLNFYGVAAAMLTAVAGLEVPAHAAGRGEQAVAKAAESGEFAFVVFHRSDDAATRSMRHNVESTLRGRDDAVMIPVQIGDASEKSLIQRFDATRIPMPATAVLAPNGAVCGVYPQHVSPSQLVASIVSSAQADCLKALQNRKIVILCAQPTADSDVPAGVQAFQKDPLFADRTEVVSVQAKDPQETRFLAQLRVPTDRNTSTVAFMAPPGVMLGVYDATVTAEALAAKLAAAGKCCDDESCKHHKSAQNRKPSRQ